jgi:GrpB-like predicted nucleotidyltransferase (UPF0157 family)
MSLYVFKEYSDIFPTLFEKEKARLMQAIDRDIQIEHIGSTSIPGLGGKGVIDIGILAPLDLRQHIWDSLLSNGYSLRDNYQPSMHVSHIVFREDPLEGTRKYHIQIREPHDPNIVRLIKFRDYLRQNPDDLQKYADIKRQAAQVADGDKLTYMATKRAVADEIEEKAMKEV